MTESRLPSTVQIYEVCPREGLQSADRAVSLATKMKLITGLVDAGLKELEVTGFFRPKEYPQLADADKLMPKLGRLAASGVRLTAHVPNLKGLDRALAAETKAIVLCLPATDAFALKQEDGCESTKDCFNNMRLVVDRASKAKLWVRVFLVNCFSCPYSGPVAPERVREIAREVMQLGVDELCLADNSAAATPASVERLLTAVRDQVPFERLAMHFHDSRGMALANVAAALRLGVPKFDASAGGLGARGGCKFRPDHASMLATEDLVFLLNGFKIKSGVDLDKTRAAARTLGKTLRQPLPGRYTNAGPIAVLPS